AVARRPGFSIQLISGTRTGVRNLAPKRFGRKEYHMEMPAMFKVSRSRGSLKVRPLAPSPG
ncbi:MAG: hypothetical protein WCC43_10630, partial [Pseudolabrys sp.]